MHDEVAMVLLVILMAIPFAYAAVKTNARYDPQNPMNPINVILTHLIITIRKERKQGKKWFENWGEVFSFLGSWITLSLLVLFFVLPLIDEAAVGGRSMSAIFMARRNLFNCVNCIFNCIR